MDKYFNVKLEFDKLKVDRTIQNTIEQKGKGYVCSVEGNIISLANINADFNSIVNNAIINICDGRSIAMLASLVHKKIFRAYIGADLFINYIKLAKYKSFFLGNTTEVLSGLKTNLLQYDCLIDKMEFKTLPFKKVEDFDYPAIAKMINDDNPDIIWVSLGAPKQEIFMSKLLPYLNKGVMFGFGAIFNFYSNNSEEKRAPELFLKLRMEWIYRLFSNPKKQFPKIKLIFRIFPKMIFKEMRK